MKVAVLRARLGYWLIKVGLGLVDQAAREVGLRAVPSHNEFWIAPETVDRYTEKVN